MTPFTLIVSSKPIPEPSASFKPDATKGLEQDLTHPQASRGVKEALWGAVLPSYAAVHGLQTYGIQAHFRLHRLYHTTQHKCSQQVT